MCDREAKQRILAKTRRSLILSSPIFSSATGDQPLALPLLSADLSGGDGLVGSAVENWLSAETEQGIFYRFPFLPARNFCCCKNTGIEEFVLHKIKEFKWLKIKGI